MKTFALLCLALASTAVLSGQVTLFDLNGQAGSGLLTGNELHSPSGTGSGGEFGGGISFDAATNILTVNVAWGSGNGFTDLTGAATAAHIHGPASITQTAGVLINFATQGTFTFTTGASDGMISGTVDLDDLALGSTDLFNGLWYINVHTAANGGGEIRGNLQAVPEPSTYSVVLGLAAAGFAVWRRRPGLIRRPR